MPLDELVGLTLLLGDAEGLALVDCDPDDDRVVEARRLVDPRCDCEGDAERAWDDEPERVPVFDLEPVTLGVAPWLRDAVAAELPVTDAVRVAVKLAEELGVGA